MVFANCCYGVHPLICQVPHVGNLTLRSRSWLWLKLNEVRQLASSDSGSFLNGPRTTG